MEDGTY
jgi:hypothetical protein